MYGPDGSVSRVSTQRIESSLAGLDAAPFAACVESALRATRIPAGPDEVRAQVPLVFSMAR
ncbi:MAG: hypothetical protein ACK6CU_29400 [Deltaproteobacteria bacterium]